MKSEIIECPIYWSAVPEWVNFVTINGDGEIWIWEQKPIFDKDELWIDESWGKTNSPPNSESIGIIPALPIYAYRYIWQRPK